MKQYLDMLRHVIDNGTSTDDRTGTGTYSVFGYQTRYNLDEGFPLATTCSTPLRWIIEELLWMRDGKTNNEDLLAVGVDIWNEWALPEEATLSIVGHKNETDLILELARVQRWPLSRARNEVMLKRQRLHSDEFGNEALDTWFRSLGVEPAHVTKFQKGELGPIYGAQWRDFGGVDQLKDLVQRLRDRPFSRRHVVTAWNPEVLPDEGVSHAENVLAGRAVLASCHAFFQCHCRKLSLKRRCEISAQYGLSVEYSNYFTGDDDERFEGAQDKLEAILNIGSVPTIGLTLQMYQRSCDVCCGARFNIAFYSALTMFLAHELGYHPEEFIHDIGDLHIYKNHVSNALKQLERTPHTLPKLRIKARRGTSIFDLTYKDLELTGYKPEPKIVYPISI